MTLKKHSIELFGHKTSISLEEEFWDALCEIATEKKTSVLSLIKQIDSKRTTPLSSAVRVFVLNWLLTKIHKK